MERQRSVTSEHEFDCKREERPGRWRSPRLATIRVVRPDLRQAGLSMQQRRFGIDRGSGKPERQEVTPRGDIKQQKHGRKHCQFDIPILHSTSV